MKIFQAYAKITVFEKLYLIQVNQRDFKKCIEEKGKRYLCNIYLMIDFKRIH